MNDIKLSNSEVQAFLSDLGGLYEKQASELSLLRQQQDFKPIESLAAVIKQARKDQGVTIEDLATFSGVSHMTISKMEKGQTNVKAELVIAVLAVLGKKLWVG